MMAEQNENVKGTAALSAKEIQLQKKNRELQEKIAKLEEAANAIKEAEAVAPAVVSTDATELQLMQAQIKLLSDQILTQQALGGPGRPRYKPVPETDFQEEGVTFSSRRVFYVIGSYLNSKGVEVMPPYKLIKLQYAASDIRKDGREESIVNSCEFTTHLKAEIKFLREHPLFRVEFFENVNETMTVDSIYREFRVKAAQQVVAMTDESVIGNAHQMGLAKVDRVPVKELRQLLTTELGDQYVRDAKELEDNQARRRLLGAQ